MKVIVDIKNKTLKMLENERSIFKGEYSADKLELYINKQLENEYPVITGLLSNGRRIGAFTTDDGYEMETIDDVEYTKAKFTLSKENGFPLSAGVTQVTIWMYRTKDSVLVSKEAIGNVVFTVVDTTAFNDGDIIISGDVEGTVVNLKVELENLQQVVQINNVAINNLQNNKADKTTLNDYLKRDGSKPMTGDLDMDYYDITNTRLYDKETHNYIALSGLDNGALPFSSKSGALELRSPEMDDLDTANFLIYPTPENTNHTAGQEYETYEWNLPKESGTIALDTDIPTKTSQLTNNSGFITNAVNNLTNYYLKSETYSKYEVQQLLSTISSLKLEVVTNLPTTNISSNTIYLKPLDSAKENNIYEEYIYINSKWETIGTTAVDLTNYALKTEIPTKISELEQDVELGVSEEDVMDIIENNAEQTDTLDIGTSATYDATSDNQIPTSKAVSDLMASAGGGSKLYRHIITIKNTAQLTKYMITLEIINNSNVAFDLAKLSQYLYDNGFNEDYGKRYPAIGQLDNNKVYSSLGLYSSNGRGFYWEYVTFTPNSTTISDTSVVGSISFLSDNTYFSPYGSNIITDTIIEL